ncbi:MAG: dienelactone hydrolase family protein [Chloroflexi bacterium]|nr:MAG: dienelactone hydrolase family protein [Chloroflexota bacterium]
MCHPEVPAGRSAPDVERVEVEIPLIGKQGELPALLARPRLNAGAGVLVVADVFGRSPFYEDLAGRLALAGYTALLPDFFFREGALSERTREAAFERRGRLDDARALVDLGQAIDWLKLQPNAGGPVGTVGFCMGGNFVLLLAAEREDLASVCYYGFPAGGPLPMKVPAPLAVADRIHGPLLGFWGDQDTGVGMENVERLATALRARGVDFEHTVYPGLGHGFLAASGLDPGHEAYRAACESWTRTIEFYRRHLEEPA